MTEQELRALVRDAIARHTGAPAVAAAPNPAVLLQLHPSHSTFTNLPVGADGACIIESAVQCNHCGYCKSYGH